VSAASIHFQASYILGRGEGSALHNASDYIKRRRQSDVHERSRIVDAASYLQREYDHARARAEVVASHFYCPGGHARDEIYDAIDKLSRNKKGEYSRRGGNRKKKTDGAPRLGVFIDATLPYDLSDAAKHRVAKALATSLVLKYGCAVETAIHIKNNELDHLHLVLTMRRVDENGVCEIIRDFNGIASKERAADGARVAGQIEWMRETFAGLLTTEGAGAFDHRSFERQGILHAPVKHVSRSRIERERRAGKEYWKDERAAAIASRIQPALYRIPRRHVPRGSQLFRFAAAGIANSAGLEKRFQTSTASATRELTRYNDDAKAYERFAAAGFEAERERQFLQKQAERDTAAKISYLSSSALPPLLILAGTLSLMRGHQRIASTSIKEAREKAASADLSKAAARPPALDMPEQLAVSQTVGTTKVPVTEARPRSNPVSSASPTPQYAPPLNPAPNADDLSIKLISEGEEAGLIQPRTKASSPADEISQKPGLAHKPHASSPIEADSDLPRAMVPQPGIAGMEQNISAHGEASGTETAKEPAASQRDLIISYAAALIQSRHHSQQRLRRLREIAQMETGIFDDRVAERLRSVAPGASPSTFRNDVQYLARKAGAFQVADLMKEIDDEILQNKRDARRERKKAPEMPIANGRHERSPASQVPSHEPSTAPPALSEKKTEPGNGSSTTHGSKQDGSFANNRKQQPARDLEPAKRQIAGMLAAAHSLYGTLDKTKDDLIEAFNVSRDQLDVEKDEAVNVFVANGFKTREAIVAEIKKRVQDTGEPILLRLLEGHLPVSKAQRTASVRVVTNKTPQKTPGKGS